MCQRYKERNSKDPLLRDEKRCRFTDRCRYIGVYPATARWRPSLCDLRALRRWKVFRRMEGKDAASEKFEPDRSALEQLCRDPGLDL
jgi:hypothetical protein